MPEVRFFALKEQQTSSMYAKACEIASNAYSQRQRCVILCASQADAEKMDELLWQLPAERFVPHNLAGEGPKGGAPVEVVWVGEPMPRRPFLINVSGSMINNINQFQQIVDFVPVEETAKQQARQRYKQFQQAGCRMQFLPADNESQHG
jgi:DNA polymerase-3 subunit chi